MVLLLHMLLISFAFLWKKLNGKKTAKMNVAKSSRKSKTENFRPKVLTDEREEGGEWGDGLPQAAHHARHAATVVPPDGGGEAKNIEGRLCTFHLKGLGNEITFKYFDKK